MKVLTLTYHWMPNYGAVLQTYALQQYLLHQNIENQVIDYIPRMIKWRSYLGYFIKREFGKLSRIKSTRKFVEKEILLTQKKYCSHAQLAKININYDYIICGSDQIWCEWFIKNAEREDCFSYYLDFVKEKRKKIAYAVSFGSIDISEETLLKIQKNCNTFKWIGVREKEGQYLLEKMHIKSEIVCDPVFLIEKEKYYLFASKSCKKINGSFVFILKSQKKLAFEICKIVDKKKKTQSNSMNVYDWLNFIKNSTVVVTDSFHCMAFSIIFHTPFWVVPTGSNGFDNRIETLLERLELTQRMCDNINKVKRNETINWKGVDQLLDTYVECSKCNLQRVLLNGKNE